jgi:alpha-glucuronidase
MINGNAKEAKHNGTGHLAWLNTKQFRMLAVTKDYAEFFKRYSVAGSGKVLSTAENEILQAAREIFGIDATRTEEGSDLPHIGLTAVNDGSVDTLPGSFAVKVSGHSIAIIGADELGVLYGVYHLLRSIGSGKSPANAATRQSSRVELRIVQQWDNLREHIADNSGLIYHGSVFYKNQEIVSDMTQIKDYARLMASVCINAICINNVNVNIEEARFITEEKLPAMARIAETLRKYGVKLFLGVNFASPIMVGGLETADPLKEDVKKWWQDTADNIYRFIPDFGGFVVKADSEDQPGPFAYGRSHVQGANVLADALHRHGGILLWRCFVYNCHVDWRDRKTDRAKAAYDNFMPIDGQFASNVILQIKNGPIDFQIREPVSPLFSSLRKTNEMIEFQIMQEYTGQHRQICYLVPMWKEALDFDTHIKGKGSTVTRVIDGSLLDYKHSGIAGISNVYGDKYWTGQPMAQANLFGFGRLTWNPQLDSGEILDEWVRLTFGSNEKILGTIIPFLLNSRAIYEEYTAPLGVGWMCNKGMHYGPSPDAYEYDRWGTYHYADREGVGVDRTQATGTGYTAQYNKPVSDLYDNIGTCPDELLLFFHHVPYSHRLHSGKTVIQHIYDTHFEGFEKVEKFVEDWQTLKGLIDDDYFNEVNARLQLQIEDAREWRDIINTYFYRKSGVDDEKGRVIYR